MTRRPKVVQTRPRAIDKPFFDEGVVEELAEVLLCVGKGRYEVDDDDGPVEVEVEDVESPVSSAVYLCTYVKKKKNTMKLARATYIRASTMAMSSPVPTDITNVCSVLSSPTSDHTTSDGTVSGPSSTGGTL
jgi:hypothetical protein